MLNAWELSGILPVGRSFGCCGISTTTSLSVGMALGASGASALEAMNYILVLGPAPQRTKTSSSSTPDLSFTSDSTLDCIDIQHWTGHTFRYVPC